MALSILGGMARGLTLKVPPGDLIRPMAVLLKRKIFDSRQDLSDRVFIDLCAGSGAVGLEAWSRGAKKVIFTEKSKRVLPFPSGNIRMLESKYPNESKDRPINIINKDCYIWLKTFKESYESWSEIDQINSILFFAPPYPLHKLYEQVLGLINQSEWYKGEIWVESDRQKGITLEKVQGYLSSDFIQEIKTYKQGTTFLSLYGFHSH